ncbi:MAG: GNAT superfamily N-acetyltransferase [Psychromonas sp.]|jgi:GNAT superfamily N-acetyltransferase|uniref:GNAT family N-acetyltransferase n=1 Tax=Psychromonas sp. TaxID=1884585 RepID=UPI0039E3FCA9
MQIRNAVIEDYESLLELFRELDELHANIDSSRVQKHNGTARNKEEFARYMTGKNAELFICMEEDEIAGFANTVFHYIEDDRFRVGRNFVLLDNLFVKSAHRRKGVGAALYQHVLKWAESNGTSNIEIQVFWGNELARNFYEKLGFKLVSVRMGSNA